jgi:hypothetical protein
VTTTYSPNTAYSKSLALFRSESVIQS